MTIADAEPRWLEMSDGAPQSAKRIAWVLACMGLVFGILGEPTGWYSRYAWYDELLHAHTSFWVTMLAANGRRAARARACADALAHRH